MTLIIAENGELAKFHHSKLLEIISKELPKIKPGRYACEVWPLKRIYLLHIKDRVLSLNLDIVLNNILGIRNSEMIRTYCLLDQRYMNMCRLMKVVHEYY